MKNKVNKAVRLIFAYDGDNIELVSQQPVNMMVPDSDEINDKVSLNGAWLELKNNKNKTIHQQILHDAFRYDTEVFSDDPKVSVSRIPASNPKGAFTVLIPDVEDAQSVSLMSSLGSPNSLAVTRELKNFQLTYK